MQLRISTEWFQHFINHAKPTAEDPVLHMAQTMNQIFKNNNKGWPVGVK